VLPDAEPELPPKQPPKPKAKLRLPPDLSQELQQESKPQQGPLPKLRLQATQRPRLLPPDKLKQLPALPPKPNPELRLLLELTRELKHEPMLLPALLLEQRRRHWH